MGSEFYQMISLYLLKSPQGFSFSVCKKALVDFRMLDQPCISRINSNLVKMYVPAGPDFLIFLLEIYKVLRS